MLLIIGQSVDVRSTCKEDVIERYLTVTIGRWSGSITMDSLTSPEGVQIAGKAISNIWIGRFAEIIVSPSDSSFEERELVIQLDETNNTTTRESYAHTLKGLFTTICLDSLKRFNG